MRIVALCMLLIILVQGDLDRSTVNPLSKNNFEMLMEKKATILVLIRTVSCHDCNKDRWNIFKLVYELSDIDNFYVFDAAFSGEEDFEKKYNVKEMADYPQLYLFRDGNERPLEHHSSTTAAEWISKETGVEVKKDYTVELNKNNYYKFIQNNPKRNILVMFYVPTYEHTHYIVPSYFNYAHAFSSEYKAVFARFDCENSISFCEEQGAQAVLYYRFIPAKGTSYDGEVLESVYGEKIVDFMNRHIGSKVSVDGGYDEHYGRVDELDTLAHQFMGAGSSSERAKIMKEVAKRRKLYKSAGIYYKYMKIVQTEGMNGLQEAKKGIYAELSTDFSPYDPHFATLSKRRNIIEQFEDFSFNGLTYLTPYNANFIIDGTRNVMVFVNSTACTLCRLMSTIYVNTATKGKKGVVFASVIGSEYPELTKKLSVDSSVMCVWFKKGSSIDSPVPAKVQTSMDSIFQFIDEHMDKVDDVDDVEETDDAEEEEESTEL